MAGRILCFTAVRQLLFNCTCLYYVKRKRKEKYLALVGAKSIYQPTTLVQTEKYHQLLDCLSPVQLCECDEDVLHGFTLEPLSFRF